MAASNEMTQKTDKENPKWYMVDLTFVERAKHFMPLALLRYIADIPSTTPPPELEYIREDSISAIKGARSKTILFTLIINYAVVRHGSSHSRKAERATSF